MASSLWRRQISRRRLLRSTAVIAGAAVAVNAIPACESIPFVGGASGTMNVWADATFAPPSDDYQTEEIQKWGKANGVQVEVTRETGADIQKKLQAAAESKQFPDLTEATGARITLFYKTGVYRPVDDLFDEFGKQWGGWYKAAVDGVTYEGKRWAIPFSTDSNMMLGRLDFLKEAGLEPFKTGYTWDQFFETAQKAQRPPQYYGVGFQVSAAGTDSESTFRMMLHGFGGSLTMEDSKTLNVKNPATIQMLEYLKKWWDAGVMNPGVTGWDNAGNNVALQEGQSVFINNPASPLVWARQNRPELLPNIGVWSMPTGPKGLYNDAYLRNAWALFKDKPDKRQEQVISLVRHLMSKDVYRKWMELAFPAPAVAGMEDLEVWKNPQRGAFLDAVKTGITAGWPGAPTAAFNEVNTRNPMVTMAMRVIVDKWPAEKAVDELDQIARDVYKKHYPDMKY
jgi:multiple sugar transport system substrate-binding protein